MASTITWCSQLGWSAEASVYALDCARAGHLSNGSGYWTRNPVLSAILNTCCQAGSVSSFLSSANARVANWWLRKFCAKKPVGLVIHWMNFHASAACCVCELTQYAFCEFNDESAPFAPPSG